MHVLGSEETSRLGERIVFGTISCLFNLFNQSLIINHTWKSNAVIICGYRIVILITDKVSAILSLPFDFRLLFHKISRQLMFWFPVVITLRPTAHFSGHCLLLRWWYIEFIPCDNIIMQIRHEMRSVNGHINSYMQSNWILHPRPRYMTSQHASR